MLLDKTISDLAKGLRKKEFSSVDLVEECYRVIGEFNSEINAFTTVVDKSAALKNARQKDAERTNSSSIEPNPNCLTALIPSIVVPLLATQGMPAVPKSNSFMGIKEEDTFQCHKPMQW